MRGLTPDERRLLRAATTGELTPYRPEDELVLEALIQQKRIAMRKEWVNDYYVDVGHATELGRLALLVCT